MFLVALAEGPGNIPLFWPIAKPYQPSSREWHPSVMGSSGAIWIDADRDGQPTNAYAYARELTKAYKGEIQSLLEKLIAYDEVVAVQAATILQQQGVSLTQPDVAEALRKGSRE